VRPAGGAGAGLGARHRARESPLFYGHLVGELVRRVDGRGIGRFLREEICGPAGLDFAFGLDPSQQARAVDLTGLDDAFRAANARAARAPRRFRLSTATEPPGRWRTSITPCQRAAC
jgi:CubicO group peptidase (beta-lactamase class C family)